MPTYEFRCLKCDEVLEFILSMNESKPKKHKIDGGKLVQVYNALPAVYKGDGWAKKERRD